MAFGADSPRRCCWRCALSVAPLPDSRCDRAVINRAAVPEGAEVVDGDLDCPFRIRPRYRAAGVEPAATARCPHDVTRRMGPRAQPPASNGLIVSAQLGMQGRR